MSIDPLETAFGPKDLAAIHQRIAERHAFIVRVLSLDKIQGWEELSVLHAEVAARSYENARQLLGIL